MNVWGYLRSIYPDRCIGVGNFAHKMDGVLEELGDKIHEDEITLLVLCPSNDSAGRMSTEVISSLKESIWLMRVWSGPIDTTCLQISPWVRYKNITMKFIGYCEDEAAAHDPEGKLYWFDGAFSDSSENLISEIQRVVHAPKKRKKSPVIYLYPRYTTAWGIQISMVVVALAAATFAAMTWLWIWIFNMTR